jgi:hypothetical protein
MAIIDITNKDSYMLKKFISAFFVLFLFCGFFTSLTRSVSAYPDVTPQPLTLASPSASPLIITALQVSDGMPGFVQIYNNSDTIVQLDGWSIQLGLADQNTPLTLVHLEYWLRPRSYAVFSYEGIISRADGYYGVTGTAMGTSLSLVPTTNNTAAYNVQFGSLPATTTWWERTVPANGKYTDTHKFVAAAAQAPLYGQGIYRPPIDAAGLKIVEILPNARNCSPSETAIDCNDYIKLYNATNVSIDLSQYRLRSDSNGLKSSSTNTFTLTGMLSPFSYTTITTRDTGEPMSLTNTGGFVWLEDFYGVAQYEVMDRPYEDASASSKKGLSWAFDMRDGVWKWMVPAPNAPNYWSPESAGRGSETAAKTTDCGPGRERNPDTNRCRNIVSTTSNSFTPCKPGQERNPETNRCRAVAGASISPKPCAADQYRNPETNRCKKIGTTNGLVPCKEGQERNPETNRCRKVTLAASDIASVKDIKSESKTNATGWWFAGAAVLIAVAYGIYEWRQDILQRLRSIRNIR